MLESRKLSLEFQSYVTDAYSKVFISVRDLLPGGGARPVLAHPHALAQTLPEDVDYGVMPVFGPHTSMLGFVNYKLCKAGTRRSWTHG